MSLVLENGYISRCLSIFKKLFDIEIFDESEKNIMLKNGKYMDNKRSSECCDDDFSFQMFWCVCVSVGRR